MDSNPMPAGLVTLAAAAVRLSIGRRKLEELISNGQIRFVQIGNRRYISEAALAEFIVNAEAAAAKQMRRSS